MNTDTGEIKRFMAGQAPPPGFQPVPDELLPDAEAALDDQDSTVIDIEDDTPLARWARKDRRRRQSLKREDGSTHTSTPADKARLARRKTARIAAKSRRRNRGR